MTSEKIHNITQEPISAKEKLYLDTFAMIQMAAQEQKEMRNVTKNRKSRWEKSMRKATLSLVCTPSVRNYKAVRTKNPRILEMRKSNIIFSYPTKRRISMCIFWGFPKSAQKQDFHLDGKKKRESNFKENKRHSN